ncbi:hypothetical protein G7074_12485 [Pedobacter sp. HDW13]|uniref:sensor histidine kinase n=1 Tax=unclassified Pedobacter TaxID=2628915 RepID=UPI000F595C2A|nr:MULTISPECIES: ATP-binding protein [unclassified Pedobacter]QIL40009.1 hypothetical protein G7074_12485 [Pedobacter sp. HDW13]RQO65123.1 hypothetical protein DBR40_24025 [Pedobacter sp. KBW01]
MEEIYSAIIIISMIILVLSGGIIFAIINYKDKQSRFLLEKRAMEEEFSGQLLQSRIEVQEITFAAMSKELHDNIGQLLSSAKMHIGLAERAFPQTIPLLNAANETITDAISELRSLARSLDREWLERFDLLTNLKAECQRLGSSGAFEITFIHPSRILMAPDRQIILFRIIQEAIQNAIRHAKPKYLFIHILTADDQDALNIKISDDGPGFTELEEAGLGMSNMRQRSLLLKGKIEWINTGQGTQVNIELPLNDIPHES